MTTSLSYTCFFIISISTTIHGWIPTTKSYTPHLGSNIVNKRYHDKKTSYHHFLPHNTIVDTNSNKRSTNSITNLRMIWPFDKENEKSKKPKTTKTNTKTKKGIQDQENMMIQIGQEIGRGSYGRVHLCTFQNNNNDEQQKGEEIIMVAKRACTEQEIEEKITKQTQNKDDTMNPLELKNKVKEKLRRCEYYLNVEKHCFEKIQNEEDDKDELLGDVIVGNDSSDKLSKLLGSFRDTDNTHTEWLVFSFIERYDFLSNNDNTNEAVDDDSTTNVRPAITLGQAIQKDWIDQHTDEHYYASHDESNYHHLNIIQRELGLKAEVTFAETLDVLLLSLLQSVSYAHRYNIVHRDIKPDNLLCNPKTSSLVLIDFGSAADMDPVSKSFFGNNKRIGLDDDNDFKDNVVAISPIYSAPELFIKKDKSPYNFDTFSCALVFLQLMFNLLDERADAAFRQQLDVQANCDLDSWFAMELSCTIRPVGLEDGLNYLSQRPGLWKLLKEMVVLNPEKRISVFDSLQEFKTILRKKDLVVEEDLETTTATTPETTSSFFESVIEAYDQCDIQEEFNLLSLLDDGTSDTNDNALNTIGSSSTISRSTSRPLHYVATFQRSKPLGLVLSEAVSNDDEDEEDEDYESTKKYSWEQATQNANPGEVYIKDMVSMGQAYKMGIFEIGDRLKAVGEIPISNGGFEKAINLLSSQPKSSKSITLHFDRKSVTRSTTTTTTSTSTDNQAPKSKKVKIIQEGVWSTKGRYRKTQEDAYILNEITNNENGILLAGIFDGHGGDAASTSAAQLLPNLIADETTAIASTSKTTTTQEFKNILESCWNDVCQIYQEGCILNDDGTSSCVANYDPINGIVYARTGSSDLIAGTTAVIALMDINNQDEMDDDLILLNCGDSRALLIARPTTSAATTEKEGSSTSTSASSNIQHESVVYFTTKDHSPSCESEMARLKQGRQNGFDYSIPQCSLNRWRLKVGDYQYAVSRSLEGTFASSKGIIYDPDVSIISLSTMLSSSQTSSGILVMASDGLFEVMDNEEVGLNLLLMRENGSSAADAAKQICGIALDKGSKDNISAVIVYFD